MGRVRDFFDSHDVGVKDVPLALVYHEVLGVATLTAWWALCYTMKPTAVIMRTLGRTGPGAMVTAGRVTPGSLTFYKRGGPFLRGRSGAVSFSAPATPAKSKWTSIPILGKAIKGKERAAGSLAESSAIRAMIKPITFPLKMYLTVYLVGLTKSRMKKEKR